MDPLKEALILLDQSLKRLETGISQLKEKNHLLLAHNIKQKDQLIDLEEKKQVALQELYQIRSLVSQELQSEVEERIIESKYDSIPSIFMSDD